VRPAATELSDSEAYDLSDAIARVVDARAPSLLALGPELALAATLGSLVLARVRFAGRKRGKVACCDACLRALPALSFQTHSGSIQRPPPVLLTMTR
jgi:hypothetical protein